jgi:F-box protein 18 (helicase)
MTFNPTPEQQAIIASTGNIKINAVAGSGKTTTIIQYAATRPKGSRILYLAFNRSVRLEAQKRFTDLGLHNVQVETAHSLAYKHIVHTRGYRVAQKEYKTHEIAEKLGLQGYGEKHGEYILANHISKFIAYFCNSNVTKVQDLNYLDLVTDEKAKAFVRNFYQPIEQGTRLLLSKMYKGQLDIPHDFYLKLFQLFSPVLPYDYILFDEGQDASPAMLDIFLKQPAVKVIVGDTHQQIYGWRHAVNSLGQVNFANYTLSTSFRFGQAIADLSKNILAWKRHIQDAPPVAIIGAGKSATVKTKATLARTNLGLLLQAINYITENKKVQHLYFEGNINSYTYADEGASLYDVLSLYNNQHSRVRDKLIGTMKNLEDLEEYIEKTEDVQLSMMVEIVKEYGNEIPSLINTLKTKHVGDEDKAKAEMIFSTVHRSKGMEYDEVQLVADFITEGRIEKQKLEKKEGEAINTAKWNEEINLLYVGITRAKSILRIPESLLPADVPKSPSIQVIQVKKDEKTKEVFGSQIPVPYKKGGLKSNTYTPKSISYTELRRDHKNAYEPWTRELDKELKEMYYSGTSIESLAAYFDRKEGAIQWRLKKLGCEDFD